MAKKDLHVTPHPDGGWQIKRKGSTCASGRFDTQQNAQSSARTTAIRDRVEVVTHGRDGRIRDSDSYGNDPHPPRDKKH